MKKCSKCLLEKPLDKFKKDKSKKSGYGSWCLSCNANKTKEWASKNPEKIKAQQARRPARKAYKDAYNKYYYSLNREKIIAQNCQYAKDNPKKKAIWTNARRARKKLTEVIPITESGLDARLKYYGGKCWICKTADYEHWDHVKPLSRGGIHMLANLRPACAKCNLSKSDKWPLD